MQTVEGIERQLENIYDDLAANVTNIFGRQDMHLAIDLAYHSPISLKFDCGVRKKAYPEVLIIGDTRTGKTQAAEAMMHHYGCGATAQAESLSYAGLVGGCQKMFDKQWDVTWGKLPQNNRRLLIIDEASAMNEKDLIGKLSAIRASGVATIEKIASQKTEARTRLLWLSNPRGRMTVGQFSSGIDVIESLCAQPEDIARWDLALVVARDDVNISELRKNRKTKVKHVYTANRCRSLVLWAWTREVDEVKISDEVIDLCFDLSDEMSKKYSSEFMLVTETEQPLKLCRMATALAARLFNSPDGVNLIVEPAHVEYIYKYVQRIYDAPHFGYDTWSANRNEGQEILDPEEISQFCYKIEKPGCMQFLRLKSIRLKDIEEYLGLDQNEAKMILSRLLRNNAIERNQYNDTYRKAKAFNQMLREKIKEYDTNKIQTKRTTRDNL